MIAAIGLVILAQLASAGHEATPLGRLRAKVPVEAVASVPPAQFAGRYTTTSEELGKLTGPFMGGEDLYLFPDGSYIYCEWSDNAPLTIYDKGTWKLGRGLVELKSDPKVTWNPEIERQYMAVRRKSSNKEILLVGTKEDLRRFEKNAGDNPGFMLLVIARKRESLFTSESAASVKARLLREAWRPAFFEEKEKEK
jgi:hypothetical protein